MFDELSIGIFERHISKGNPYYEDCSPKSLLKARVSNTFIKRLNIHFFPQTLKIQKISELS